MRFVAKKKCDFRKKNAICNSEKIRIPQKKRELTSRIHVFFVNSAEFTFFLRIYTVFSYRNWTCPIPVGKHSIDSQKKREFCWIHKKNVNSGGQFSFFLWNSYFFTVTNRIFFAKVAFFLCDKSHFIETLYRNSL